MTDDEARAPVVESQPAGQSEERTRRSRRRGKRSKNKSTEAQPTAGSPTQSSSEPAESQAPAPPPSRDGRRASSSRDGYRAFHDGLDRFVCLDSVRSLPEGYPVQHRRGIAIAPMREVARRDAELLLCNLLHNGHCLWPDGEVVHRAAPESARAPQDAPANDDPSPGERPESSVLRTGEPTSGRESSEDQAPGIRQPAEAP